MNKYYILTFRYTHKKDIWLSFWRPDNVGYCWYKDWAGIYLRYDTEDFIRENTMYFIKAEIVDALWEPVFYENKIQYVIFNSLKNIEALNIMRVQLKGYYPTRLGFYQRIDENFIKETRELVKACEGIPRKYLKKNNHAANTKTNI